MSIDVCVDAMREDKVDAFLEHEHHIVNIVFCMCYVICLEVT